MVILEAYVNFDSYLVILVFVCLHLQIDYMVPTTIADEMSYM